jgi:type 1 fimbria pilin
MNRGPDESMNSRYFAGIQRILALIMCVLGMCMTLQANATCSFANGSFTTGAVNFGNVSVPQNAPVGTTIASIPSTYYKTFFGGDVNFFCGSNVTMAISLLMSGTGNSGVYPTNIPGIGIRIDFKGAGVQPASATLPLTYNQTPSTLPGAATTYIQLSPKLVVTGPIGLSVTNQLSYNVGPFLLAQATDGSGQLAVSNLTVTATLASRSCSVTTPSVAQSLPTVSPGSLNSGSSGATSFSLGVNCASGVKVYVTLTDASNVSNTSTTLGLTPGSTATGIGLQILTGSTLIAYGPDSAIAGNLNQWLAGTSAGGPMNIPLIVRYARTTGPRDKVKCGVWEVRSDQAASGC